MTEERRLVTILFSDVAGSTALGEAMDPEDIRALLARYFAIAREAVEDRGGTVEKFIGDAVMAVFGLPTAHDDDAARAASAALDLRDRVRTDPHLGERLPIRLGLATGEVVAAMDGGGGDFLITGDAVNVAARLQQGAASWEIVATERTARAAGPGFSFGSAQELETRGRGASVQARLLEGVTSASPRRRTPFLGRDADVAQLELTAARALHEKRPYLVTVTAPAGTGKSRLLEEFLERLPSVQADARVVTAQCLPYGQRLTYAPLRPLLVALLGLPEDCELEELRSAAESWLTAVGDAAPRRTADLLAATFGATEGDPIDRAELFAAWRSAIELAAREQPLVVVVEDLHWSADSLLDLIEVILQPRGEAPLLMIVLARPELLDRRPTWSGGRRNSVSIALEPLDDLTISALVDFYLHGPPAEVVAAIVGRAGGNPFFAGELARTITDRGVDLNDPEAVNSVMSTLPDTVHAAVLARMDLLPPAARRWIQVGSVFGRSFRPAGVVALSPELAPDRESALDALLEQDLLRAGHGDEVVFRHILIREVGYQTLPRAERARLHGAAGIWLEGEAVGREDEQAELVAFHLREAIGLATATGADLDEAQVERAVFWLRRAADAALAGAAQEEGARHIRSAIEIAPPMALPELWMSLGDMHGGGTAAIEAYATALRLGRELGLSPDFVLRALSGQLMVLGRWAGSVGAQIGQAELNALLDEVRTARAAATDPRAIGYSLVAEAFLPVGAMSSGAVRYSRAEFEAAAIPGTEAVRIARELDDPALLSAALDGIGALTLGVDPVLALQMARERVAMDSRLPLYERIDARSMVAWNAAALGQLDEVVTATESIQRDLAPNQAQTFILQVAAWQLWGLAMLGRWPEVGPTAERACRLWEDAGRNAVGYALHGYMAAAEVGWALGDERLSSRTTAVLLAISDQYPAGHIFRRLAAFAEPDPAALVETVVLDWQPYTTRLHLVERALSLCVDRRQPVPLEPLGALEVEARERGQRLLLAQVLRARGVLGESPDHLREALELFRTFGARPLVARAEVELGRLTDDAILIASGVAGLERLGDLAQLGRAAVVGSQHPA
jgi:class 3 adenylate cyclase/TPR repeat protein